MDDTTTPLPPSIRHPSRPLKPLFLDAADVAMLEEIANCPVWPEFQIRKAKVIMAMANGGRVCEVSEQLGYGPTSIWRFRDQFRKGGVAGLLKVRHRTGRRPRQSRLEDPLD